MAKRSVVWTIVTIIFILLPCVSPAQEKGTVPDALTVIHSRKSVRNYLDKPVTKDQLTTLMKAAMAAPTAMDRRPWVFIAITDRATLDSLAEGHSRAKMLKKAPSAIIVCGDTKISGTAWVLDCSAATENLLLAAEAIGLGAVWCGVYPNESSIAFIQKTLGIPVDIVPLNIIPIGWPTGAEQPKQKFDEKNIHWEKW